MNRSIFSLLPALSLLLMGVVLPLESCPAQEEERKRGGFGRLFRNIGKNKPSTPSVPTTTVNTPVGEIPLDAKGVLLRSTVIKLIPADRHYRETLANAIVGAYRQKGYKSLWEKRMPDRIYRSLTLALVHHGMPENMALDPNTLAMTASGSAINRKDLSYTVAIADAGTLIKLGAVPTETLWPEWNKGDRPGRDGRDTATLTNNLLKASSSRPFNLQTSISHFAPKNWVYRQLQSKFAATRSAAVTYSGQTSVPDPSATGVARPGQPYPYAHLLAQSLIQKGYLNFP
ncbi:MAG: hypothetical protein AAF226_18975, partial [Verrucomicrobiota bacterium]